MATRLRVDRQALLDALDLAQKDVEQRIKELKKEMDDYDWRKDARAIIRNLQEELKKPDATSERFGRHLYRGNIGKPQHEHSIERLKHHIQDIEDFRQLVGMTMEETFSVSTSDEFISGILRRARHAKRK